MIMNNKSSELSRTSYLALLVLTCLLAAVSALAQTETGQIVGKVVDPNGASVSGANVKITSIATGRTVNATSDSLGQYTVVALQPGLYDVTVESGSFKPGTQRVQVTVGSKVS